MDVNGDTTPDRTTRGRRRSGQTRSASRGCSRAPQSRPATKSSSRYVPTLFFLRTYVFLLRTCVYVPTCLCTCVRPWLVRTGCSRTPRAGPREVPGACEDRIGTGPPRARTQVIYVDLGYCRLRIRISVQSASGVPSCIRT